MIRLSVTTSAGRSTFLSDRTEILVGSREGADLRIEEPGVARNHCLLRVEDGSLMLIDLGSPSGVQFAGQVVRQARMQIGSGFRLGDVLIEIEELGAAVPAPAAPVVPATATAASAPPPRHPTSSDPRGRSPTQPSPPPRTPPSGPVSSAPSTDFGREIRQMLAKAPWYAISAIVHALALFVLWQIPYSPRVVEPSIGMQSVMTESDGEEAESPEDNEPDLEELADEAPEEEFEDFEDDAKPRDEMPAPMEVLEENPIKIGIATPNYRIKLSKPKGKSLENGEAVVDRSNVQGAQERAKDAVQKGLGRGLKRMRGQPASRIVVVKGEFDEIETVLSLYRVPHVTIERAHLVTYNLRHTKVLCIDCGRSPTALQKNVLVNKIKKFTGRGGWLITSDWALTPYLTDAFPDFLKEVLPRKRQTDTTVAVEQSRGGSPLMRDVLGRKARTLWWLEEASKFIGLGSKGRRVNVLVFSEDMKRRYGSGIVAVEFKPNKGRVLHLMGHFYQKDGNHAGVVAMHQLIFNFLQERFPSAGRSGDEPE